MSQHPRVNPIRCAAHGLCAELLPEHITLDDWGYPVIDAEPLRAAELEHAKMAVAACPVFAIMIEQRNTPVPESAAKPYGSSSPGRSSPGRR
jgi:ferredoxin